MTFARLVVKDLFRSPLRVALTISAGAIAALAFVFLQTVLELFYLGVAGAQMDRLIVRNKTSITQRLPLSYGPRIAAVPGVEALTFQGWFGGRLSEAARDQFPNFFVESSTFLSVFTDYTVPPEQATAFRADPCGALVGEDLAERYGWDVGSRIVLKGTLHPGDWTFNVRGIYGTTQPGGDTTTLFFGFRCVNEKLEASERDQVGIFAVRIDDPSRSVAVASTIDAMFANSPFETRTESERAFQLGFVAMTSAIVAAIRTVSYIILLILLLIVSNTLAMGVREKTVDLATLKALGFRSRHLMAMVVGQSVAMGAAAAVLGLSLAPALIRGFVSAVEDRFGAFPDVQLRTATLALAAGAVLCVALLAAALPAIRAARIPVAEGLRKEA